MDPIYIGEVTHVYRKAAEHGVAEVELEISIDEGDTIIFRPPVEERDRFEQVISSLEVKGKKVTRAGPGCVSILLEPPQGSTVNGMLKNNDRVYLVWYMTLF